MESNIHFFQRIEPTAIIVASSQAVHVAFCPALLIQATSGEAEYIISVLEPAFRPEFQIWRHSYSSSGAAESARADSTTGASVIGWVDESSEHSVEWPLVVMKLGAHQSCSSDAGMGPTPATNCSIYASAVGVPIQQKPGPSWQFSSFQSGSDRISAGTPCVSMMAAPLIERDR